jgi:hypothetical protein
MFRRRNDGSIVAATGGSGTPSDEPPPRAHSQTHERTTPDHGAATIPKRARGHEVSPPPKRRLRLPLAKTCDRSSLLPFLLSMRGLAQPPQPPKASFVAQALLVRRRKSRSVAPPTLPIRKAGGYPVGAHCKSAARAARGKKNFVSLEMCSTHPLSDALTIRGRCTCRACQAHHRASQGR